MGHLVGRAREVLGVPPTAACPPRDLGSDVVQFDAGRVNQRLFLLMFSCGFDADVVHRLHQVRTGPIRHWSYFGPILRSMANYRYPELEIDVQRDATSEWEVIRGNWLFAFNFPCYARGIRLAPRASASDGQLDACIFRCHSLGAGLVHFASVLAGLHGRWGRCWRERVRRLRIRAVDGKALVPFQTDGDPGGHLPVEIDILAKRLSLLLPSSRSAGRGH